MEMVPKMEVVEHKENKLLIRIQTTVQEQIQQQEVVEDPKHLIIGSHST